MTEYKNYRIPESMDEIFLIHSDSLKSSDENLNECCNRIPQMIYSDINRNIIISTGISFEELATIDSEEKKIELYNNRIKCLLDAYSDSSK